jgi:hypothetical protein
MPADTVPQCLSHAGNNINPCPLRGLAAPYPPPRPGPGAYPLLVQSDARGRGRDLEVEVSHAANRENASPATLPESPAS